MTDSTIKIYNARYSKLMKLLDFIAVNLFIFAYLKYFFVEPSTASLFLGIIYSLIFIRANEHFQLYSGQFKGQYLKKLTKLFFSVSISGLLSFLLFVSAELLLNNHASTNAVRLAEIISDSRYLQPLFFQIQTQGGYFRHNASRAGHRAGAV